MGTLADVLEGMAARAVSPRHRHIARSLLRRRASTPELEWNAAVLHALRTEVFADFEDPADDPDLGDPIG